MNLKFLPLMAILFLSNAYIATLESMETGNQPEQNAQALEALHAALKDYDVPRVEEAIAQGANVNDGWGSNSILHAVIEDARFSTAAKALAVIRVLIDAGADVNVTNKYGLTALRAAIDGEYADIVRVLI